MQEVKEYAKAVGLHPGTVIQRGGGMGGNKWSMWQAGASCSMRTADRIRAYMAANPAPQQTQDGETA